MDLESRFWFFEVIPLLNDSAYREGCVTNFTTGIQRNANQPPYTHTHTHTQTIVFASKSDINSFPAFDVDDVVDMRGNEFDVPLRFGLLGVIP